MAASQMTGVLRTAVDAARQFWDIVGPGGKLHPQYFLENRGHLVVESLLLGIIVYLFLQQAFKPKPRGDDPLSDKEMDALVAEWRPEPLVPRMEEAERPRERVVTAVHGHHAIVDGKRVLNLASANFLNFGGMPEPMEAARATVARYGVGSCGPRGFYGTIDVHLQLEAHLAEFMGCPICTIFSFDIATIASVIPACANRKDIIIMDERCNYAVQQGVLLSRASVHSFKHNDMEDLQRVLEKVEAKERADKKPLCRKLIIVEGIFATTGDIPPLDEVFAIKERYKYRLLVDESLSFGVLGPNGRGCCEQFGLTAGDVEVICASMSGTLGSIGGFCVGDPAVVEHQRLAGSGYVFSASLPPFLGTAADEALALLRDRGPMLLPRLRHICSTARAQLEKVPGILVSGGPLSTGNSPVVHLTLAPAVAERVGHQAFALISRMAERMFDCDGIMVSVPLYSCLEKMKTAPSLRIFLSAAMTDEEVSGLAAAVRAAAKEILP
uniref:serine C-palmitoyltransferase n=1 Tax=Chlamydomonas euryale TaxID=1486919 RepID=A0A7R9V9J5_9CHLO|mmetsp:Transcript_24181/g.71770  ORF Transcript_24181/g.71770 Transcript_24181/m.71770 type:complete len:497 (+) Transcript_24181:119-1609(+)|eukprot:100813-Chlamydomonas_euryale.AAC.5